MSRLASPRATPQVVAAMVAASGVRLKRHEDDLGAVRAHVEGLLAAGRVAEALDVLFDLLGRFREDNDHLRLRLHAALRSLYGRSSERVDAAQVQGVLSGILDAAATAPAPDPTPAPAPGAGPGAPPATPPTAPPATPPRGRPHGRGAPPAGLPVERHTRPLADAERRCPCCGGDVKVFDHETVWSIDYKPGALFVVVYECEKGACPRCPEAGVVQADAPAKPVPGGQPGPGLLARLLVDKGEDALPLQRQVTRLAREGFAVAETTVQGWWDAAADRVAPLVDHLLTTILAQPIQVLDGSRLPVLDRDHPKGLRKGTTWPVVAPGVGVVFTYEPTHGGGLQALFDRLQALRTPGADGTPARVAVAPRLVVDGEGAIATRVAAAGLPPPQLSGMHARRTFKKAFDSGDARAAVALAWFRTLFDVERHADAQGLDAAARRDLRQRDSAPVLEALRVWTLDLLPRVAPRTPLGKALRYVAERWLNLGVYLHDGRIPFDTGDVERRIRRLAVGRHNYLFTGSDEGARRLCRVLSLCGSCRMLGIDPWAYLRDVFTRLAAGARGADLDALLPAAWLKQQAQQVQQPDPAPS